MTLEELQLVRTHVCHEWTCNALKLCGETAEHDNVPCEHKKCDCGADKALAVLVQWEKEIPPPPAQPCPHIHERDWSVECPKCPPGACIGCTGLQHRSRCPQWVMSL